MNWCFQLVTIVTCVLTGLVTDLFNIVPACVCVCVCVFCFVFFKQREGGQHAMLTRDSDQHARSV